MEGKVVPGHEAQREFPEKDRLDHELSILAHVLQVLRRLRDRAAAE